MDEDVRSAGSNTDSEPREVAPEKRDGCESFMLVP
jgi:hypothetical protein